MIFVSPVALSFYNLSPSLSQSGVFMLNLVCRDPLLRKSVLERVHGVFPSVFSRGIEGEVNEVLLCSCGEKKTVDTAPPALTQAANNLQSALCSNKTARTSSPNIDIAELLKDLKVA